jgi:hypothetical protein
MYAFHIYIIYIYICVCVCTRFATPPPPFHHQDTPHTQHKSINQSFIHSICVHSYPLTLPLQHPTTTQSIQINQYAICHVPPPVMFKARIFSPPRLCAVFEVAGTWVCICVAGFVCFWFSLASLLLLLKLLPS